MLANILSRVIAGVVTLTILTAARLYFGYYMLSHVRSMHTDAAYSSAYQSPYRSRPGPAMDYVRPPSLGPDHSGWTVFNSSDPVTGLTTRHAKLVAASAGSPDGLTIPASSMELTAVTGAGKHVFLTLPSRLPCATLTTIAAKFDAHPPSPINVTPGNEAQCVVEVADYAGFLQSLRDSDVLTIQLPGAPDVTFAVGGLSWD
jgi:hypothetical protein